MNEIDDTYNGIIAVIMSIYKNDTLDYVRQSVDSILNQTYNNIIFYIVYDGPVSADIDSYLTINEDKRLRIFRRERNLGLAHSLNELLELVKKENYQFIARMDADDVAMKDRFEKQISYLNSHPEVDMVGGAINEIDETGNPRGKITKYPSDPSDCRAFFAKRNPVAHPTVMFRRRFFDKAGWEYPTDYMRNEDTRLWHEGYKHGCLIANIPDVVLNFRMTDSMFTQRRNGREFAKSQLKLRKLIAKDLGFGVKAYIYAYFTYILMISPSWVLKIAYKVLR